MKRSPIVNLVTRPIEPTLELDGVYFTIACKESGDGYFLGNLGCVVHAHDPKNRRVLIVASRDGEKMVHKCGVRTDHARQVYVETLKAVAKLQGKKNWRDVPRASLINDWVAESLSAGTRKP